MPRISAIAPFQVPQPKPSREQSEIISQCPACGSANGRIVGVMAPEFDITGSAPPIALRHPEYSVVQCDDCALYYKSARLSEEALAAYYKALPFEQFETDYLMRTDRALVSILREAQESANVLDYGCGVGRILSAAGRLRHGHGVEINERSAAVAVGKGIKIITDSDLIDPNCISFDYIILSDVFEHLLHPVATLEMLFARLNPGGRLVIATGNGDSFPRGPLFSQNWYFRVPGHLQVLSPRHVEWFAKRLRLNLEHQEPMSHYDMSPIGCLVENLRAWAFAQFRLHPHSLLSILLKPIPFVGRASRWKYAPAVTHTSDHLVIVLRKP